MATIRVDTTSDLKGIQKLNAVMGKSVEELKEMAGQGDKAAKAAARLAAQVDPLKRNEQQLAKLALETKKFGLNTEDAARRAAQLERRLQDAGAAGRRAFGAEAVGEVKGMIAGFASLNTLAAGFSTIMGEVIAKQKEAAAAAIGGLGPQAKLTQLAGADSAKARQLQAAADAIYGQGFVSSRDAARGLTFELGSAGLLGERAFFSQLALVDDASLAARSVGLVRSNFRGGDATGTAAQIVSKAMAGAAPATGVSPAGVAAGVGKAAESSKALGFTDEQTFAAVSMLAQATGSGETAGDRLRALNVSLTRQGFADTMKGAGLQAMLANVRSRGMSEAEKVTFFGSVEAAQAAGTLSNQAAFKTRLGEIQAAQSSGLAGATIRNALGDNRTMSAVLARRGAAANVLSQDALGAQQNLAAFVLDEMERRQRAGGMSEVDIAAYRYFDEKRNALLGPGATIQGGEAAGILPESGAGRMELLLERNAAAAERQVELLESGAGSMRGE